MLRQFLILTPRKNKSISAKHSDFPLREKRLATRILAMIAVSFFLLIGFVEPSQAVPVAPPTTCTITPTFTKGVIEPWSKFRARAEAAHPNMSILCKSVWQKAEQLGEIGTIANNTTTFNYRYDKCTNGSLNPAVGLRCFATVAFNPSVNILKKEYEAVRGEFSNNMPFSFMPIVSNSIEGLQKDWNKGVCSSEKGLSEAAYDIKLSYKDAVSGLTNMIPLNFKIPCNPPAAMKPLRALLITALWLGFALWLYESIQAYLKPNAAQSAYARVN